MCFVCECNPARMSERMCAFYLRRGHASQAIFRAPAADLLGHLLSTSCDPGLALRHPPFHRAVTQMHANQTQTYTHLPLHTWWEFQTHSLLIVSVVSGGGRALLRPGPPSWVGEGGSTRWNSNGVRFCVRYTTWPSPAIRQTDREMGAWKGAKQDQRGGGCWHPTMPLWTKCLQWVHDTMHFMTQCTSVIIPKVKQISGGLHVADDALHTKAEQWAQVKIIRKGWIGGRVGVRGCMVKGYVFVFQTYY